MGATMRHVVGKQGVTLARRLQKYRTACSGKHVVAGYISGVSTSASIERAYKNEFGAGTTTDFGKKMPARPFISQSVPIMKYAVEVEAETLNVNHPDEFLERAGRTMADSIRVSIDTGSFERNSDFTIGQKGHSKVLVDTGEMYKNAKSQIRKG